MNIVLRKANVEDARFVFDVCNQESVRKVSWDNEPLIWKKHKEWFNKNYSYYWIIEKDQGFVRLKDGEVSIALLDRYQNRGIGTKVLKNKCLGDGIHAEVKLDNLQSLYCFLNAGFKPTGLILKRRGKRND